jgi:DNA-binding NarL/FixJ family response regulator
MPRPIERVRVLLADDHSLVAAGLRSMLDSKFDVVGIADNGRALVQAAELLRPDVILLDISMPELNGIDAARKLRKLVPNAKLIFVTMHTDASFVREALRAGGSGYVTKQSAPAELVTAVEEVLRGHTYLTPVVTRNFVDQTLTGPSSAAPAGELTPRQREVLQLVAEGRSAKDIAESLGISPKTVEFHKSNVLRSLGLRTTADLVKYAIRHGLVSAE